MTIKMMGRTNENQKFVDCMLDGDCGAWRRRRVSTQKKNGVFYQAVYQSADDPNDVTVIHDFHRAEKAKAFAALPELKAAMEKSGVKGAPQIWYTTKSVK
jgi:hypothetical protein